MISAVICAGKRVYYRAFNTQEIVFSNAIYSITFQETLTSAPWKSTMKGYTDCIMFISQQFVCVQAIKRQTSTTLLLLALQQNR